jgi:hypothetical protein
MRCTCDPRTQRKVTALFTLNSAGRSEMADDYEVTRIQDKALNEAILSNDISFDFLPFNRLFLASRLQVSSVLTSRNGCRAQQITLAI